MVNKRLLDDALNTNKTVYGPQSELRQKERRETMTASDFFNLFNIGRPEDPINPEHLDDYVFLMRYKLNYEVIFRITNEIKLRNKDIFLEDVCKRVAPQSVLAQLFYGITRQKLGDDQEANQRAKIVRELLTKSAFWRKRFEVLDLYSLLDYIS